MTKKITGKNFPDLLKLIEITKLLQEVYGNELNNEKNDFDKVFETITDDLRYYLVYETMDKE